MKAFEVYAIVNNGQVVDTVHYVANTGGYTQANVYAVATYGDTAFAVNITQYPVALGDTYDGTKFYHEGTEVQYIPTEEETVEALNSNQGDMDALILDHEERLLLLEVGE